MVDVDSSWILSAVFANRFTDASSLEEISGYGAIDVKAKGFGETLLLLVRTIVFAFPETNRKAFGLLVS